MGILNGGLINIGSHGAVSTNALSAGLACFTGSFSGVTTTSIGHNLNSSDLVVEFRDHLGNLLVPDTWAITNANVIEAEFSPAATGNVTIIACIESGLAPITGGVTTVEGLSGIIDLDSPNNSIVISTSGQVIQLNAIFTPASGAVLAQKCLDIDILSGLVLAGGGGGGGVSQLNSISGAITLTSPDESVNINVNVQDIELTTPGSGHAPSGASYLLREYDDNGHIPKARILSATSGIRLLDRGARSTSGLVAMLDFDNEPTANQVLIWNGFKLQWEDQTGSGDTDTQTSINGISGTVTLVSPNDTISIVVNGQTIELDGIFTWASGQLLESLANASGVQSINDISGILSLVSENDGLTVTNDGQVIRLTSLHTGASGAILAQKCVDVVTLSGIVDLIIDTQMNLNGLSGAVNLTSPDESININVDGQDIEITTPGSGAPSGASYLLREYNDNDHLTQARILSATSGVRLDDQGARSGSGVVVTLDFQDEPRVTEVLSWNGSGLEWVANNQTIIEGLSGVVDLNSPDGTVIIGVDGQTIQLTTLPDDGQTSVEGISGLIDLDSPDESININVDGQTIELTTPTSGAPSGASYLLREYDDNDHLVKARILSATSGIRLLDRGARSTSGLVAMLDFDNEPAVNQVLLWNGFKLQWGNQAAVDTQTTINGISGAITLDSPNDTISIVVNGQTIELDGIFTWASGQLLESLANASGVQSINDISGILSLVSENDGLTVTNDGQTIRLTSLHTGASGAILEQKCEDLIDLSGLITGLALDDLTDVSVPSPNENEALVYDGSSWVASGIPFTRKTVQLFTPASGTEFVVEHALRTEDFVWSMWRTDSSPSKVTIPRSVTPSGSNHAIIEVATAISGKVVFIG